MKLSEQRALSYLPRIFEKLIFLSLHMHLYSKNNSCRRNSSTIFHTNSSSPHFFTFTRNNLQHLPTSHRENTQKAVNKSPATASSPADTIWRLQFSQPTMGVPTDGLPSSRLRHQPLTIYTWTECTENSAPQTLVPKQVASLHVLQKSCGDSGARF